MPKFPSDVSIIKQFEKVAAEIKDFQIHFGPIASGDEDIMSDLRKK